MPTPAQLYSQIRDMAFDVDENLSSESELYGYMSDAELKLAKKIPCTGTTTTDSSVIDQREYDRPSDALKIVRVVWNEVKLKKVNLDDIDLIEGRSYGGVVSSGNPIYYYEFGGKIGLSPLPAEVQTIKYYYLATPAALTSISTVFTIPNEYAHYIQDYCLFKMFIKDDLKGDADRYLSQWLNNLEIAADDWLDRTSSDKIETVELEEVYPATTIGMV